MEEMGFKGVGDAIVPGDERLQDPEQSTHIRFSLKSGWSDKVSVSSISSEAARAWYPRRLLDANIPQNPRVSHKFRFSSKDYAFGDLLQQAQLLTIKLGIGLCSAPCDLAVHLVQAMGQGTIEEKMLPRLSAELGEMSTMSTSVRAFVVRRMFAYALEHHRGLTTMVDLPPTIDVPQVSITQYNAGIMQVSKGDTPPKSFRFLDLPPELRNTIYRAVLVNGPISIRADGRNRRANTHSGLRTSSILQLNKQIYDEARDILCENPVYLNMTLNEGAMSTLTWSASGMMDVLPRLQSVMLVIDAIEDNAVPRGLGSYDWRVLQKMTGLKKARICIVWSRLQCPTIGRRMGLLSATVRRLPSDCVLSFGAKAELEKEHMYDLLKRAFKQAHGGHLSFRYASGFEQDGANVMAKRATLYRSV